MSDAADAPWWERLAPGSRIPAGVVLIDCGFADVSVLDDAALHLRAQYAGGTEYVARAFGAAEPIQWVGNRATLIFGGADPSSLAEHTFTAARYLWQRAFVDLGIPARIAVHVGHVIRRVEPGAFDGEAITACGALLDAAPPQAIALSADVALSLRPNEHADLAPLASSAAADDLAYVFPRGALPGGRSAPQGAERELELWDALRDYANGPEVRSLRYVGFRLQRKEPLCLDLDDVFVEPLAVSRTAHAAVPGTAPRSGRPTRRRRRAAPEESPPSPLGAFLRESRHLVVLGDPGSGKTTVLRWLAMTAAEGRLPALIDDVEPFLPLPVSVGRLAELRHVDRRAGVPDVLARYYAERNIAGEDALRPFLARCLRRGRCLVLLDGLDEVRAEERAETQRWLEHFVALSAGNRFVATSRVVGYAGFRAGEGAVECVLQPFDEAHIERYVRAFHRAYLAWEHGAPRAEQAQAMTDELLEALRESSRLGALASNPFMLSALALIHRAEGRLPRHRVQAYELLSRALCETWDRARRLVAAERHRAPIAYEEEAIPILGDLALAMHEKHPSGVAPTAFVTSTLAASLARRRGVDPAEAERAARDFLKRATDEAPILLERGPDRWGFLHLTFQEFFVAVGLHATERFEKYAMKHALEPRWEEILHLGVGHMALIQNRTLAASRVVMQVLQWQAPPWCRWVDRVLQKQIPLAAALTAELPSALQGKERSRMVRALARYSRCLRSGEHFAVSIVVLDEDIRRFHESMRQLAGTDLAAPVASTLVDEARTRPVEDARILIAAVGYLRIRAAVDALVDLFLPAAQEHPELLDCLSDALREVANFEDLIELAQRPEPSWRVLVLKALTFTRSTRAAPVLVHALRDGAVEVREAAAGGLCVLNLFASVHEHLSQAMLLEALEDRSEDVRSATIVLLSRGKFSTTAVEGALLKVARSDASQRIRCRAALAALLLFSSDRVLNVVMGALAETSAEDDRRELAQGLGAWAAGDDARFQRILDHTRSPSELLRAGCVLALGQFPSNAAEDAALRATSDTSAVVRREAVTALWDMGSSKIPEVASAALDDGDASVREKGAEALTWWSGSIAEKALLRGVSDPASAVRKLCVVGLNWRLSAEVTATLVEALGDEEAAVRESAAFALAWDRADRVTQVLLAASSDENERVRAAVAWALENHPHDATLTRLLRLLKDVSPRVRWSAATSIASIDDASVLPALVRHARREPAARAALWHMAERRGWKFPRTRAASR